VDGVKLLKKIHKETGIILGMILLVAGAITFFFNELASNLLVLGSFIILLLTFMNRYKRLARKKVNVSGKRVK